MVRRHHRVVNQWLPGRLAAVALAPPAPACPASSGGGARGHVERGESRACRSSLWSHHRAASCTIGSDAYFTGLLRHWRDRGRDRRRRAARALLPPAAWRPHRLLHRADRPAHQPWLAGTGLPVRVRRCDVPCDGAGRPGDRAARAHPRTVRGRRQERCGQILRTSVYPGASPRRRGRPHHGPARPDHVQQELAGPGSVLPDAAQLRAGVRHRTGDRAGRGHRRRSRGVPGGPAWLERGAARPS